ncbi:MAG: cell division protein ZapA [Ruminococcaceae bacterium]|nr:cell division protein ZapA [Oscillospiraceae bacterium]
MPDRNKLVVKIGGGEYTLSSSESREYMLSVADLVDKKMQQVKCADPTLGTANVAVLTAVNLADDLIRMKKNEQALSKNILTYTEKIRALESEIERLKRR